MRKNIFRKIAWILIASLLFSVIPVDSIRATEPEMKEKNIDEMFNYLYINQPQQQTGEEQTVIISMGDGKDNIEDLELAVEDESGKVYLLKAIKNEDGVYLFKSRFPKGVYHMESICVMINGSKQEFTMEELEINAYFSVGTECPEKKKSEHIEVENVVTTEQVVETTVVSMDEDGVASSQNTITDALEEADTITKEKVRTTKKDIVIVLDPGHDSKHAGATYFGIDEHESTLKIADYCREELETYDGITVYMTRKTAQCPYPNSSNNLKDIEQRVKWAKTKGADAYISIHLNASDSSSPKGAEVYYHPSNSDARKLSQKIQDELVDLGLYDRGIQTNEKYTVIKTAQSCGFPGIIVEHAFMSNKSDSDKYLKTDAGLKKLGIADATGIAKYYKLPKIGAKVEMEELVYTVSNQAAMDMVLTAGEEEILLNTSEKSASQRFEVKSAGGKYYYIVAEDSGKVLGVVDNIVKLEEQNEANKGQKWTFLTAGEGYYYLRSESGMYLSVSENKISVENTRDENAQKWFLEKASYRPVAGLVPKLLSAENVDGKVLVKWKELTGAEGYYIYRRTESTEWKKAGSIAGSENISYTDSKAPENTKCYYTVRAYKGEEKSFYDEQGLAIKTPQKKTYEKHRTTTSVNYRTGPGTGYSKAGTLAKGKEISVEKGYSKKANGYTWYRFKLNSKNYYIASKYVQKVVVPDKPKLVSAKYSDGTVTVKWKKAANAKGYYVYRKLSGKEWSRIATVKSGSTLSYKDKSVAAGKKYIYTVRAYNGSERSGYYSDGVSVTIPKESLIKYKTTTKVNYRSGAGTKYAKKGTLSKGKTISVVKGWSKTANGLKWYKIKISGKYYYVSAKYLKKI